MKLEDNCLLAGKLWQIWSEVAQLCPTLCNPMECSLPGSSFHGFFQAIVLEWIAISFSRGSSQARDRTRVSHIVDRCFTVWATREVKSILNTHWKDWCWSWNSSTLATWCKELTYWKIPWCWERLRAGGEGWGGGFEQTLGDSEGQGSLIYCIPWGSKESDTI